MTRFSCPYLNDEVELTDERRQHIVEQHPELAPFLDEVLGQTLVTPDLVVRSSRIPSANLFSRWYNELRDGKHVVAVVVSDGSPVQRHWIITAYLASKLRRGAVEWPTS
jgi:hypothetical protein